MTPEHILLGALTVAVGVLGPSLGRAQVELWRRREAIKTALALLSLARRPLGEMRSGTAAHVGLSACAVEELLDEIEESLLLHPPPEDAHTTDTGEEPSS